MSTNPPRLATWLLARFLRGPNREALVGDLVERHALGNSNGWFWRQTISALVADVGGELRAHYGAASCVAFFLGFGAAALLGTVKLLPGLGWLDDLIAGLGAGWIVGRVGGLATAALFASFVLLLEVTAVNSVVMGVLDHFGGLWLIAHHGLAGLPSSLVVAEVSILCGGLIGARRTSATAVAR